MSEATETAAPTPKSRQKSPAASAPASIFEVPKFEMPKMEVPAAFREIAEKGIAQAKENYERMKSVAEEATDVLETTYATASKGASGYGLKMIEHARANTEAAFDLMSALIAAKSYSEAVELSSVFMRKQFDAFTAQARDLAETAQKAASETAEPVKDSVSNALKKVA